MLRTSDLVVVATIAVAGCVGSAIDLRTRRVPNALTFLTALLGLLLAVAHASGQTLASASAGLVVGLALMLPAHIVGATGGGDVKLFAAFGTLLGPWHMVTALFYTAIAGGVLALVVALCRGSLARTLDRVSTLVRTGGTNVGEIERGSRDNRFAYAPAIVVGTLAVALGL